MCGKCMVLWLGFEIVEYMQDTRKQLIHMHTKIVPSGVLATPITTAIYVLLCRKKRGKKVEKRIHTCKFSFFIFFSERSEMPRRVSMLWGKPCMQSFIQRGEKLQGL